MKAEATVSISRKTDLQPFRLPGKAFPSIQTGWLTTSATGMNEHPTSCQHIIFSIYNNSMSGRINFSSLVCKF